MTRKNHNQSGFMLIELLIAGTISSFIVGGLVTAIILIGNVTGQGNDHVRTLQDIQSATHWITKDAQMAGVTDLVEGTGAVSSMDLGWIDDDGGLQTASYRLEGSRLLREQDDSSITIAWYIVEAEFSLSEGLITYRLESGPPGKAGVTKAVTSTVAFRSAG